MEITNWNTTSPFRIVAPEKLFNNFPLRTVMGLNDER